MTFMKLKLVMLVALSVVLVGTQIAKAETIFLKCGDYSFTVDLEKSTVNNKPVTINATAIDWQEFTTWGDGTTRTTYWKIDRTTGTVTHTYATHFANGNIAPTVHASDSCTVGGPPTTKF